MNKLKAADYRKMAWGKISGKRATMVGSYIVLNLILAACSALSVIGVGAVGVLLITGPLNFGFAKLAYNCSKDKEIDCSQLFDGFQRFADSFLYALISSVLTVLWTLLLVIPGIIKSLSYSMGYYVLNDNPGMSGNDARKKSMEMMKGNKWRLFCLKFSFIGWILLSILTFGILMLWVAPRMEVAKACFYESLNDNNAQAQVEEKTEVKA